MFKSTGRKGIKMKTVVSKKAILALVSTLFWSITKADLVQTFGGVDCGVWIQGKTQPDRGWLLGYMTGLNMDAIGNPLGKITSAQQIYLWMDSYCMKNPLSNPVQGGRELLSELKKK